MAEQLIEKQKINEVEITKVIGQNDFIIIISENSLKKLDLDTVIKNSFNCYEVSEDCNISNLSGLFQITSNTKNIPEGFISGFLKTYNLKNVVYQEAVDYLGENVWYRRNTGTDWEDWKRFL